MTDGEGPDDVLAFWFSAHMREHWFASTPEIDDEIATRFAALHARACRGEVDHWADRARGALALVIVLDQFPRNLHRGTARAYDCDAKALAVARAALERGFDRELAEAERAFLYMPFMHSERLKDQEESVRLFVGTGLDNAPWALHHRDLIRRFGRFPHRNALLGRESTPEEEAYLASEQAFRG